MAAYFQVALWGPAKGSVDIEVQSTTRCHDGLKCQTGWVTTTSVAPKRRRWSTTWPSWCVGKCCGAADP